MNQLDRIEQKLDTLIELLQPKPKVRQERPAVHFEAWWKTYPTKVAKQKCLEIWKRRNLDKDAQLLIADVRNRVANCNKWKGGFIPNPSTYLNQARWQDELDIRKQVIKIPSDLDGLVAFAAQHGIQARAGESLWDFRQRVENAL